MRSQNIQTPNLISRKDIRHAEMFETEFKLNEIYHVLIFQDEKRLNNIWTKFASPAKAVQTLHRGSFCQFPFRWIYYCHIIVVNPPEKKLAKHTSVYCLGCINSCYQRHETNCTLKDSPTTFELQPLHVFEGSTFLALVV